MFDRLDKKNHSIHPSPFLCRSGLRQLRWLHAYDANESNLITILKLFVYHVMWSETKAGEQKSDAISFPG